MTVGGSRRSHGLGRNHVFERSALVAWEDGGVYELAHLLQLAFLGAQAPRVVEILAQEYDASTRAAKGLVGRRCHDVGIFHGVLQQSGRNESSRVRHVYHEQRANLVGNLAH